MKLFKDISIDETIDNYVVYKKTELEKLKDNIQKLINENEQLRAENKLLKSELKNCSQNKNEHKAGRKNKFNNEQIQEIIKLKSQGKSIRQISREYNCSIGLVHKLINRHMM